MNKLFQTRGPVKALHGSRSLKNKKWQWDYLITSSERESPVARLSESILNVLLDMMLSSRKFSWQDDPNTNTRKKIYEIVISTIGNTVRKAFTSFRYEESLLERVIFCLRSVLVEKKPALVDLKINISAVAKRVEQDLAPHWQEYTSNIFKANDECSLAIALRQLGSANLYVMKVGQVFAITMIDQEVIGLTVDEEQTIIIDDHVFNETFLGDEKSMSFYTTTIENPTLLASSELLSLENYSPSDIVTGLCRRVPSVAIIRKFEQIAFYALGRYATAPASSSEHDNDSEASNHKPLAKLLDKPDVKSILSLF